ncbi:hypothetical protein KGF54_004607 [Candida jiufengensis]|uniref:uncharacterized protein n=1 Tax=Candida jiufengensis TaxID=497108 RepID=UPI002224AB33|nr:uncharacterized protein KGF54_004607 [Candida jiufengensis]KAI5951533.1 hypothetical protein KGF54_004607 [Candida jiufengensis]
MVVLDLNTGKAAEHPSKINRTNSKISKDQKSTGIKINWIYDIKELVSEKIGEPEDEVENVEDRGQYFNRPEGAVGVLVQSGKEPATFAGWYGETHNGDYNLFGEQPEGTQQIYYLADARTIFVGLF